MVRRQMRVFVHLAHGLDARVWAAKAQAGLVPGGSPYGYDHALRHGCQLSWSQDADESVFQFHTRRRLLRWLGFDLLHTWRNRGAILASDIVWTHREIEHLAVSLLLLGIPVHQRPRLIAQSIWLFDNWFRLPRWRRRFYAFLMRQADLSTTLSSENLRALRLALPEVRAQMVPFGICVESFTPRSPARARCDPERYRVFVPGNDRHRDWRTL